MPNDYETSNSRFYHTRFFITIAEMKQVFDEYSNMFRYFQQCKLSFYEAFSSRELNQSQWNNDSHVS